MTVMMILSPMIITYTAYLCSTYNEIDIIIEDPVLLQSYPAKRRQFEESLLHAPLITPTPSLLTTSPYHSLPSHYNVELRHCM